MKTTFHVQVYKRDGSLWTEFTKDDYHDVVVLMDDWKRQPGTGQVLVAAHFGASKDYVMNWKPSV